MSKVFKETHEYLQLTQADLQNYYYSFVQFFAGILPQNYYKPALDSPKQDLWKSLEQVYSLAVFSCQTNSVKALTQAPLSMTEYEPMDHITN